MRHTIPCILHAMTHTCIVIQNLSISKNACHSVENHTSVVKILPLLWHWNLICNYSKSIVGAILAYYVTLLLCWQNLEIVLTFNVPSALQHANVASAVVHVSLSPFLSSTRRMDVHLWDAHKQKQEMQMLAGQCRWHTSNFTPCFYKLWNYSPTVFHLHHVTGLYM